MSQKKEDRGGKRQGRENSVRNVDSDAHFPLLRDGTLSCSHEKGSRNSRVSNLQGEKFRLRSRLHPERRRE